MHLLAKAAALTSFLLQSATTNRVSWKWLFRTHTRLFPLFLRQHEISIERADAFTYLLVDGKPYVWPADADVEPLKHLVAELVTPEHPHRYDYGATPITADDVVLDIGCCDGGFAAKAVELGAAVIAVEPSRTMAAVITRLFELRKLPAPEIRQCLLGSEAGTAFFQDNVRDPAQSQITREQLPNSYAVSLTTIDALAGACARKITYIKCDAEGADFQILRGGRRYLSEHHPKIAVTAYHRSDDFQRITGHLRELGYATICGKGLMYVNGEMRVVLIHAA